MNKRSIGAQQEELAAHFICQHGGSIIERNFHDGRSGEIDLVGWDGGTLIFVEVKYRASEKAGEPEEAVTPAKQRTICRTARFYLYVRKISPDTPVRFDVVSILKTDEQRVHVRWIKDAFPYQLQ